MRRRVLFVIRGKLGDTLVAYATVRRYLESFPGDDVTLFTRAGYAALLSGERQLRIIGFAGRISMLFALLRIRLEPAFDGLLVLWGFGPPIKWIGRLIRASRKVYLDERYVQCFPEYADLAPQRLQSEPMWQVARIFEPNLPQPDRLSVPSLAARRAPSPKVIGIAPLADEARRIMSRPMLDSLLRLIAKAHPAAMVRVFVNRSDRGCGELVAGALPEGAVFHFFPQLDDLVAGFAELAHLYCTDTGLYHLAAAMGIPATVFFGPTQPWKNMMPAQDKARGVRVRILGGTHCEVKRCNAPVCIEAGIFAVGGDPTPSIGSAPAACPMRAFPVENLAQVSWYENPRHKA